MTQRDQTLLRKLGRKVHGPKLSRGWQRAVARALGVGDAKVSDVLAGMAGLTEDQRQKAREELQAE